jgi:hypothetical protein
MRCILVRLSDNFDNLLTSQGFPEDHSREALIAVRDLDFRRGVNSFIGRGSARK